MARGCGEAPERGSGGMTEKGADAGIAKERGDLHNDNVEDRNWKKQR